MNAAEASDGAQRSTEVKKDNKYYERKYARLRKTVVEMVHENGALCQEIKRIDQKTTNAKAEKKYLLKRLLQYEKPNLEASRSSKRRDTKTKRKIKGKKKDVTAMKSSNDAGGMSKDEDVLDKSNLFLHPLPVDSNGRPIFPIEIDGVSIYSIGDVVHDRPGYHTNNCIFPVGYCSTRLFNSIRNPTIQCLYTCKILDVGPAPRFEISPEDDPNTVFANVSIEEAYTSFRNAVIASQSGSHERLLPASAFKFFGLSLPVVQNLIQSLPGSKKCFKYEWKKFEVRSKISSSNSRRQRGDSFSSSKLEKDNTRQSDINIEALEKWARDQ